MPDVFGIVHEHVRKKGPGPGDKGFHAGRQRHPFQYVFVKGAHARISGAEIIDHFDESQYHESNQVDGNQRCQRITILAYRETMPVLLLIVTHDAKKSICNFSATNKISGGLFYSKSEPK